MVMDNHPTITISGPPGSGTSTAAKLIAAKTGLEYQNTGAIFRQMAVEYKMSLADFGSYVAEHPEIDQELDRRQVELANRGGLILEGRLAGLLAQREKAKAFTLFIGADVHERARRCCQRDGNDPEEGARLMIEREELERQRFLTLYQLDLADTSKYNLVIDSGTMLPDQICDLVVETYNKWAADNG